MTTPTADLGVLRKDVAIDPDELALVQERLRRAVDVAAVVEHETGFVRVPEIFEERHLY